MTSQKTFDALTDFILNQSEIIWTKFSAIYNCGSLPKINIVCKPTNTAGFAYYNLAKGVEFNLIYFAEMSELDKLETIAHELAHVTPLIQSSHTKSITHTNPSLSRDSLIRILKGQNGLLNSYEFL